MSLDAFRTHVLSEPNPLFEEWWFADVDGAEAAGPAGSDVPVAICLSTNRLRVDNGGWVQNLAVGMRATFQADSYRRDVLA